MAKMTGKHIAGTNACQCRPRWCVTAAITWVLIATSCLHAQQRPPTEYEVKAAYLYNFGKFVEWPAKMNVASNSFTICMLGQDPLDASLEATIAGESINVKKVAVKRVTRPQDAMSCHILFISSLEESRLKEILATIDKTSVLTVSDMPEFTRRGGMIQFVEKANRVRFEVNLRNAERAGLSLSSQLLKVATSVTGSSQPGD